MRKKGIAKRAGKKVSAFTQSLQGRIGVRLCFALCLVLLASLCAWGQYRIMSSLTEQVLRQQFNAASNYARVIAILSPT